MHVMVTQGLRDRKTAKPAGLRALLRNGNHLEIGCLKCLACLPGVPVALALQAPEARWAPQAPYREAMGAGAMLMLSFGPVFTAGFVQRIDPRTLSRAVPARESVSV